MTHRETTLELTVAAEFGCLTRRQFNRAGYSKGWVIFVDTLKKRFVVKETTDARSYWRNFLYCFQEGTKRPTVLQQLRDMAREVAQEFWVGVFTTQLPNLDRIRSHGYVQCHAQRKATRARTIDSKLFEYKHRETGLSFFIAVAQHTPPKDVLRRLIARMKTVQEAEDLPTRIIEVKKRISEDAGKCLQSACLVHAGEDPDKHFEVIERVDFQEKLMSDRNSGAGLVRTLNLGALTKAVHRLQ